MFAQAMTSTATTTTMMIVSGRPNQTAMPLAYWKSGRRIDLNVGLDPGRDGCGLIWYAPLVEMKPNIVRRHVDMVREVMPRYGLEPMITLISLSQRCFVSTVPLLFDLGSSNETAAAHECLSALLSSGAKEGFLPYRVGSQSMDWLMGQGQDYWRFVSRLKRSLDPKDIISPGRYAPLASAQSEHASLPDGTGLRPVRTRDSR